MDAIVHPVIQDHPFMEQRKEYGRIITGDKRESTLCTSTTPLAQLAPDRQALPPDNHAVDQ